MTNEQIVASHGLIGEWLNMARTDERAKVEAKYADKVPREGSLEWAIQQRRKGVKTEWRSKVKPESVVADVYLGGWSIVPDEPKAMTDGERLYRRWLRTHGGEIKDKEMMISFANECYSEGFGEGISK